MPIVAMPDGAQVQFPDDMPPDQIRSLILQKFPDAEQQASQGMSAADVATRAIKNIPSSAAAFVSNTVQPIIHPIETAENIKDIGEGVLQKFGIVSGDDKEKYADAVGQFFKDRYGSLENVKRTIATDPVGVLADLSTVLTAGGGLAIRGPGAIGKIGEVVSKVGRAVDPLSAVGATARGVGKIAAEGAGVTTGAGSEAIKTAARAGAEGGDAARAFREGMSGNDMASVVNEAKSAINQMRMERGNAYRDGMASIKADNTVLGFDKIDDALAKLSAIKTFKGQDLSPKTQQIRLEIGEAIKEWRSLDPTEFHTAEGLDALKQKIGDIRDATQFGTPERLVADQAYQAVRGTIIDQAPEYAKVMKGYEDASKLIREIESTLSVKPNANIDTTLRKLQSVLRNNVNTNYGRRAELLDFLQRAGAPHLMEKLAGQALSSVTPRGLSRAVAGGEGVSALGAAALGHPLTAATLGTGLLASSPSIVGGAAYGLGRVSGLPLRQLGQSAFQIGRQNEPLRITVNPR